MAGIRALALVMMISVWFIFEPSFTTSASDLDHYHNHNGRKLAYNNFTGFLSIDCGGNEDHIDEETGLSYISDSDSVFVDTGIALPISHDLSGNIPEKLKNVRSFPQGTRNCYTLKLDQGIKNNNYLIRAVFKYGNYDGKNQPPVFDLYLGVNKWSTVDTNRSDVDYIYREIFHVPSRDYIDVCLVKAGNGVPFISALELRLLNNSIYRIAEGKALTTVKRYDVGRNETASQIRYPDDQYDRIWGPLLSADWIQIQITTDSTNYTESNDDAYKLPALVLRTAAKTQNASIPLLLNWSSPHSFSQIYAFFCFAEIEKLEAGQQRELTIHLNDKSSVADSIKLDYLKPSIIGPISGAGNSFSIDAAEGSTLPPILNGFEIIGLIEFPNSPTALDEFEAIMEIKKLYRVTRNWQGDPCVPSEYLWDGLKCSNSNPPSIISLNLSSSKLTGEIKTLFSNLKEMQSLDLSYNELTGTLPEFLAQLPNLKILNLSGNKLEGSVPEALLQKSMDGKLILRVDENPDLCLSAQCKKNKKNNKNIIVAIAVGVVLVLFIFYVWFICKKRRQGGHSHSTQIPVDEETQLSRTVTQNEAEGHNNTHQNSVNEGDKGIQQSTTPTKNGVIESNGQRYSYDQVKSITDNLKNEIGNGGFGKVYRGTLEDGTQVAVKLLIRSSDEDEDNRAFQNEAQLLLRVHHKNLVSLVGYCDENENKALIYEYMANGDLSKKLSETNTYVLNWNQRLKIAVDVAQGLKYLHNDCNPPIIHRDLKPSNILLNQDMQAKIADFGLSRAFANQNVSHVSTNPAGTFGYLPPEWQQSRVDNKFDVYSCGVFLFELITGSRTLKIGKENIHMADCEARSKIEEEEIQNIIDPKLQGIFETNSAQKAVNLAMSCTQQNPDERPEICHVLKELKECLPPEMDHGRTQMTVTDSDSNRKTSSTTFRS